MKDLEARKGLLGGEAEEIQAFGFGLLENALCNEGADDQDAALEAWLAENREYVDGLTS